MYSNIGGKIKTVAVLGCIIGIIASLIVGILMISQSSYYNPTVVSGVIVIIAGSLVSWIGSFCLFGFGELIEKTDENNEILSKIERNLVALNDKILEEEETRAEEGRKKTEPQECKIDTGRAIPTYPYPLKHYNDICPNCHTSHSNWKLDYCRYCGARFAPEEAQKPAEEQEQRKTVEADNGQGVPSYPHTLKYFNCVCPNCGLKYFNRSERDSCIRCGAKFASKEP